MERPTPTAGTVLMGRYELQRELGAGGMGSVWLARQRVLDAKVAIKIMASDLTGEDASRRFLAEARLVAGLNSPHVVKLFDYGVENGLAFLAMELLQGQTLGALLKTRGRLSPGLIAELLSQVCKGVATAHDAGVVHRDLKPDNVFLLNNDGELFAKVLDFGVAKAAPPASGAVRNSSVPSTHSGMLLGTGPYMSPEQWNDPRAVTPASDIWSIGVIGYQCAVGELPFQGATLSALVMAIAERPAPVPSEHGEVPDGFDEWFARCTARSPAQRFASVREASRALTQCCGQPAGSGPPQASAAGGALHGQRATLPTVPGAIAHAPVEEHEPAPPPSQASRRPVPSTPSRRFLRPALLALPVLLIAGWLWWPRGPSGAQSEARAGAGAESEGPAPRDRAGAGLRVPAPAPLASPPATDPAVDAGEGDAAADELPDASAPASPRGQRPAPRPKKPPLFL